MAKEESSNELIHIEKEFKIVLKQIHKGWGKYQDLLENKFQRS